MVRHCTEDAARGFFWGSPAYAEAFDILNDLVERHIASISDLGLELDPRAYSTILPEMFPVPPGKTWPDIVADAPVGEVPSGEGPRRSNSNWEKTK
jgi:hypothetical protein